MPALFDAYLIVDWSADSAPETGKDSIWWRHLAREKGKPLVVVVQNPAARTEVFAQIKTVLLSYRDSDRHVLAGFDSAYGYPAGLAESITPGAPAWLAVWRYPHEQMRDSPRNANDRFAVAARVNRLLQERRRPSGVVRPAGKARSCR